MLYIGHSALYLGQSDHSDEDDDDDDEESGYRQQDSESAGDMKLRLEEELMRRVAQALPETPPLERLRKRQEAARAARSVDIIYIISLPLLGGVAASPSSSSSSSSSSSPVEECNCWAASPVVEWQFLCAGLLCELLKVTPFKFLITGCPYYVNPPPPPPPPPQWWSVTACILVPRHAGPHPQWWSVTAYIGV